MDEHKLICVWEYMYVFTNNHGTSRIVYTLQSFSKRAASRVIQFNKIKKESFILLYCLIFFFYTAYTLCNLGVVRLCIVSVLVWCYILYLRLIRLISPQLFLITFVHSINRGCSISAISVFLLSFIVHEPEPFAPKNESVLSSSIIS